MKAASLAQVPAGRCDPGLDRADRRARLRRSRPVAVWPKPRRLAYRRTDALSEEAQELMIRGFANGKPYLRIVADLAAIGEPVGYRTVARRGLEWRREQGRRAVLAALNVGVLAGGLWRPAELIAFVEQVDLRPGWAVRCRRRLWRILRTFFKCPSREGIRAIESELFVFWLAATVSKQWPADGSKGA